MKALRNFRMIPLLLAAIIGLAGLKIMGLVLNGGYIFDARDVASAPAKPAAKLSSQSASKSASQSASQPSLQSSSQSASQSSWAQDMFNFPSGMFKSVADPVDVTGSIEGKKMEGKEGKTEGKKEKAAAKSEKKSDDTAAAQPAAKSGAMSDAQAPPSDAVLGMPDQNRPVPAAERAILERLQERRQELEARAREIDIRENLLKSAEKRIEDKVGEIKASEARVGMASEQKNQLDAARFKGIVTMYEGMKPKDAAKIFDRLEMSVLIEVASQIAPRKMSEIVGLMQPEAAERLTVEMARRAGGDKTAMSASDLPKIEGKSQDGNN
jgi:flagellar motility protein MotE (MotC chaperone)